MKQDLEKHKGQLTDAIAQADEQIAEADEQCEEDDEGYEDEFDKAANFNPHSDDPEAVIEAQELMKSNLRDALDEVTSRLSELENSRLKIRWTKKDLPPQLWRIDEPWLNFKDPDAETGKAEKSRAEAAGKGKSKRKQRKDASSNATEEKFYAVKLLAAGAVRAADGRRFNYSDAPPDKSAIRSLLMEGEELMKFQWRYILTKGDGDFQSMGILPIIACFDVMRHHPKFQPTYEAGFVYPHCKHGTVMEVVKRISGRKNVYWFEDHLLMANLKVHVQALSALEYCKIKHGNIHPTNLAVSDDGFNLLIADFLPDVELRRWYGEIIKHMANAPEYISPEFHRALIVDKMSYSSIKKRLNFHKNDVYCLGLVFYFLLARQPPEKFHLNEKAARKALTKIAATEKHDPELIELLRKMLEFDPEKRPTFLELLNSSDRFNMEVTSWLSALKKIAGFDTPDVEKGIMDSNKARRDENSAATTQDDQSYCSFM
eukprot:Selendium_serpulae@DN5824_c1_g1_i1.p1